MPVIRRRHQHRIHIPALQDPAKILGKLQPLLGRRIKRRLRPRPTAAIRIAEPDHIHVGLAGKHLGQGYPSPAQSHKPQANALVGTKNARGGRNGQTGGKGGGFL